ncbi:MAG: uncharacterized protein QOE36_1668 [Gaiellaceae bacterium]|jgi:uncharacterized protein YqjF (DUF2071 family)|nr:uncharacterized protein [Gaiellaceae bacterium]
MGQTWEELLFAHWRVPAAALREHVPAGLEVDLHEGEAWLGITPFRVSGLRLRGTLPLPRLSTFLELNVRTYVTDGAKPGIWFFSLDASSQLAVEAARRVYRLPYFHARMSAEQSGGRIVYECVRHDDPGKVWSGRYAAAGDVSHAEPGSLEWFLAERYCLYTTGGNGRLARAEIHHEPWPLQPAQADIELNSIAPLEVPDEEPVLHFSHRQDVVIWPLEAV